MSDLATPLLEVKSVSKSYPGVRALDKVDFEVRAGEVHCLAGENGAGKSTLIEIIGGSYAKDSGTIHLKGKEQVFTSPKHAQECGIAVLHQELPILRDLSVAENIFLGRQPRTALGVVNYGEMNRQARKWLGMIHADIDPRIMLGRLPVSKQQLVSIAKAISLQANVIIFDEPSAVLTTAELDRLFEIIRAFRAEGRGIVYISHRLEEIFEIGDRVTVLRNGKLVGTEQITQRSEERRVGKEC
jgi:ribose transport system ATP-binding protein